MAFVWLRELFGSEDLDFGERAWGTGQRVMDRGDGASAWRHRVVRSGFKSEVGDMCMCAIGSMG